MQLVSQFKAIAFAAAYQAKYAENKNRDDMHQPVHLLGTGRYARKQKAAMSASGPHDMSFGEFSNYNAYEDPAMHRAFDPLLPPPIARNPYEDFESASVRGGMLFDSLGLFKCNSKLQMLLDLST